MQDQTFADSLDKCIFYFGHLRHIKQCVHQLPKQVQNLLDVRAHGRTATCAMTMQHGTEALNLKKKKNQTLHILKYWALTSNFHGKKEEKEFCLQSPSTWSSTEAGMHKEFVSSLCNHQIDPELFNRQTQKTLPLTFMLQTFPWAPPTKLFEFTTQHNHEWAPS